MMKIDEWRAAILSKIRDIADKQYQEEAWFGKGKVVDSPDEMYCKLIDDFTFDDFIASKEVNLSAVQKALATDLKISLNECSPLIDELKDPARFIDNPSWVKVRAAAKAFLDSMTH